MYKKGDSVLLIVQSQSDIPDNTPHSVFVIDSALTDISDEEYNAIESKLRALEIDSGTSLPLYHMFFVLIAGGYNSNLLPLPKYIYLIKKLKYVINNNGIDEIITGDLSSTIDPVLTDLKYNIEADIINYNKITNGYNKIKNKIISILWTLPILLDQLLAIASYKKDRESVETIFFPAQNRFRSMKSVCENMTTEYTIVPNQALISYKINGLINPSISDFEMALGHQYASLNSIFTQIRYLAFEYIPDEIVKNNTETELACRVSQEFGVNLDTTISSFFQSLYSNRSANSILNYFVYKEVFKKTGADNVVVGTGYGPISEAVWLAGKDMGMNAYDLPHTITLDPPRTGFFTDYTFITGEFAKEYIRGKQINKLEGTKLLSTGRPYLEKLNKSTKDYRTDATEPLNILIATQPYNNEIRRKFLKISLKASDLIPVSTEIVVKPHPNESKSWYESFNCSSTQFIVKNYDIWDMLQSADIVLTINSNVGLEAIIADCLTIGINLESFQGIQPFPYSKTGPIPLLTSESEVRDFFEELTLERTNRLKKEQYQFVMNGYILSGAAERVASEIES